MEEKKGSLSSLLGIFSKFPIQQKMMMAVVTVISLLLFIIMLIFLNQPTYSNLYTNLSMDEASKIVTYLKSNDIPYKLSDGGNSIKVPQNKVDDVRLGLASKGIPNSGTIGYKLFDKNTMGMSEFMQKITYKRALEGEIAKTIKHLDGIENAWVKIVFPAKSVFKDEEKKPTASVVLKLRSNAQLSRNNIVAISNLVASSVEGLKPADVTIIDTNNRLLSNPPDSNPLAISSGKQYEVKRSIEKYLEHKAQSMLQSVLGYGNSAVRVNVNINFKQVEKTMELYDPESQVVISQQTIKNKSAGASIKDSNKVTSENTTTNYEISKTIEKVMQGAGTINRLTVAAVINGIPEKIKKNGKITTVIEPRSQQQLQPLADIIKKAIGFDAKRHDEFSIVSIPFVNQFVEPKPVIKQTPFNDIGQWTNLILIVVAILASLFVLRGLMKKLKNEKIIIGTIGGYNDQAFNDLSIPGGKSMLSSNFSVPPKSKKELMAIGDIEDEITDEAALKKMKQEKIINYVEKNPTEAAKLINSWLKEDEF